MDEKTRELVEAAEFRSMAFHPGTDEPDDYRTITEAARHVRALCAIIREQAAQLELLGSATKVGAGETLVLVADKGMTDEGRRAAAEALYGAHPSPVIVLPHGWSAIQVDELCRALERAEAGIS